MSWERGRARHRRYFCLYVIAIAAFVLAVARFWHPVYGFTSLVQMAEPQDKLIPALQSKAIYLYPEGNTYDGAMYAQIAYDPGLEMPELASATDILPYRGRRILLSFLAWCVALGNPDAIIYVYPWLNFVFWIGLVLLLWRWFPPADLHNAVGFLGVIFSAGVLQSVRLSLTDMPALTLGAAGLALVGKGRSVTGATFLGVAGLSRETILGSAPALAWPQTWRPREVTRSLSILLLVVAPAAIWTLYVSHQIGGARAGFGNFGAPLVHFLEKWRFSVLDLRTPEYRWARFCTVLSLLGLTVQVGWLASHPRWPLPEWRFGAVFLVLFVFLGPWVWEGMPGAALRVLLPLHLAFALCVPRTRLGLAALCLGSLSVFSGIDAWRVPPQRLDEFAIIRSGDAVVAARASDGWYAGEPVRSGLRFWSKGSAEVKLATYTSATVPVRVSFSLRSLTRRTLRIRSGERDLWSGPVDTDWSRIVLPDLEVDKAGTVLEFVTEEPPSRASKEDSRELAFCLKDFTLQSRTNAKR